MKECSKGIFKLAFYFYVYFDPSFRSTTIMEIGRKLKQLSIEKNLITNLVDFFENAIIYRITGQYKTEIKDLRSDLITYIFSLLDQEALHKKMNYKELVKLSIKMDSQKKLQLTQSIILKNYNTIIKEINLYKDRPVLRVLFHNEVVLYIRYNDYGEYFYSVIFSPNPDDQMGFENYDDVCDVKTHPHHFHVRGLQSVIESPMSGEPNNDIPILLKNIIDYINKYTFSIFYSVISRIHAKIII